ncbi:MAG: hypothetical protein MZU91_05185 [Desulfosudis oleivorans]|nr:hypothetical protein [Desulfosudis oleivorans]
MYGYDRIPAVLPEATLGIEEPDEGKHGREEVKRRIREALLMAGFTEAVNFSFMGAPGPRLPRDRAGWTGGATLSK